MYEPDEKVLEILRTKYTPEEIDQAVEGVREYERGGKAQFSLKGICAFRELIEASEIRGELGRMMSQFVSHPNVTFTDDQESEKE